MNRLQLAALLGVHEDTITDYARNGMPVLTRGGAGREGAYDAVECLAWWREQQGRNAKEAAQTRLYENNAILAQLKILQQEGSLLPREQVIAAGRSYTKGWAAALRAFPRRLRNEGILTSAEQEAAVASRVRDLLLEISVWKVVADVERTIEAADVV